MPLENDFSQRIESIQNFRRLRTVPFTHEATGKFIDYWFNLPKQGLIPVKSGVDLRGLRGLAANALMLEYGDDGSCRVRLAGTAHTARWGFEPTNTEFFDIVAPQNRERLAGVFAGLFDTPCGVVIEAEELYASGQVCKTETVLFPLQQNGKQTRILLGMGFGEKPGIPPEQNELLAMAFYKINSASYVNIGAGIPG